MRTGNLHKTCAYLQDTLEIRLEKVMRKPCDRDPEAILRDESHEVKKIGPFWRVISDPILQNGGKEKIERSRPRERNRVSGGNLVQLPQ